MKTLSKNKEQHRKKGYQGILCKDLQNVRSPMLSSPSSEENQAWEMSEYFGSFHQLWKTDYS